MFDEDQTGSLVVRVDNVSLKSAEDGSEAAQSSLSMNDYSRKKKDKKKTMER